MASAGKGFYAGARTFEWLVDIVGLPIDQINFLFCQCTALMCAFLYRITLPPGKVTPDLRHAVALTVGIGLGYFCFGHMISHLVVQATLTYIIMNTANPQVMHRVVLTVAILYLSTLHLLRQTYDYGGWTVDITGPLMIATQKVTSVAFSLHDGLVRQDEKLSPEQRRQAIRRMPTMLEYFSYIFNFQSIMCGPLIFYNDYVDFVEGRNFAKHIASGDDTDYRKRQKYGSLPSPLIPVLTKLSASIFFALCLLFVVPLFPVSHIKEDAFLERSFLSKMLYFLVATSVIRSKYYHAWLLGESICNASGIGFTGYTEDGKAKWDLITNVDILHFELSLNFRETLATWNKSTQTWLKVLIYDRVPAHKTLLTYILSAVWHGFYPGYYITFMSGALLTESARHVRRVVRPYFQGNKYMAAFYDLITCLWTRIVLAYMIFPFVILELVASLRLYYHLYFWVHILAFAALLILPRLTPRRQSSKMTVKSD